MRKILLSVFILGGLVASNRLIAQCDLKIANLIITKTGGPSVNGPDCEYKFDASFDIITNSGFKFLFFHSWKTGDYPSPSIFDCTKFNSAQDPGTSAQLGTAVNTPGKSFLDIGFINLNTLTFNSTPQDVTANFATSYPHDNSVVLTKPSNSPGLTAFVNRKGTSDTLHFEVTNIKVLINGGCGPLSVKTDIWGSNANSIDPKAQCFICGLSQTFNNPGISITKDCLASPFSYTVGLTTGSGTSLHVVYKVYMDDLDFIKEPGGDDPLVFTSGTITLPANTTTTFGPTVLPSPYCCIDPWAQWGIFVIVDVQEFSNSLGSVVVAPSCAALPIKLKSFNAVRNRSDVDLKWETDIETNNKGFYLERKLSNGGWQDIGFIASKAGNGNSNTPLAYNFTDFNNTKGISQYRLRQIDIDGRQAYSLIRSVRGEGQKGGTIIYPNPSNDGKVNVVFEDKDASRNVSLLDMNGRVIRQWKNVMNNTLQIENLVTGFYTLRIINSETGEQVVEKIVVKNR